MLSHTRMGVPYEYTHMGRPIRVWANIRIWGRTLLLLLLLFLFGRATVKLKQNVSVKTIDESLEYQYPLQWAFKSAIFLCDYRVWTKTASFWTSSIAKP